MQRAADHHGGDVATTPEGRLWLSVLLQAAVQLHGSTAWLAQIIECDALGLRDSDHGDACKQMLSLRSQLQMHVRRVRDAEEFFFDQNSTFLGICEMLGYDAAGLRSKVAACLREHADAIQKTQCLVEPVRRQSVNAGPGSA